MTYWYEIVARNAAGIGSRARLSITVPPSAPDNLSVTAGNTLVGLTWNAVSSATSYQIYRASGSATPKQLTPTTPSTVTNNSYTDRNLMNGTLYRYQVRAVNTGGVGPLTAIMDATPQIPLPARPTGFSATAGNAAATLSWNTVAGATSYTIYRDNGRGGALVALSITPLLAATTYTDSGLANGRTYRYQVAAVNAAGTGARSAIDSATSRASMSGPTGLSTTATRDGTVAISWTAVAGANTYNLYRATTPGGLASASAITVPSAPYTDRSLTQGLTYYYQVAAVAGGTVGDRSTVDSVTLPPAQPMELMATAGDRQITLSWTAVAHADAYHLYRATSRGSLASASAITVPSASYTDRGRTNNTAHYYQVAAINTGGEGTRSTIVSETPAIDTDDDGLIDTNDPDDDNDGIADGADSTPRNPGCIDGAVTQNGSAANPYCIDSLAELQSIENGFSNEFVTLSATRSKARGVHYRLTDDIDAWPTNTAANFTATITLRSDTRRRSSRTESRGRYDSVTYRHGFDPIDNFRGVFDGGNHFIYGLAMNRSATGSNDHSNNRQTYKAVVGLFGVLGNGSSSDGTRVHNLFLSNVSLTGNDPDANLIGGAIAAIVKQNATVEYCGVVSGRVTITGNAATAGGLVGLNNGAIRRSYARTNVSAAAVGSGLDDIVQVGGLVGVQQELGAMIANSYATGNVSGSMVTTSPADLSDYGVGGLAGTGNLFSTYSSNINTSYTTSNVQATNVADTILGTPVHGFVHPWYTSNSPPTPNYHSSNARVQRRASASAAWTDLSPESRTRGSSNVYARTLGQLRYPTGTPTYVRNSATIDNFRFITPRTETLCNALFGADTWSNGTCVLPTTFSTCYDDNDLTWVSGSCGGPLNIYTGWNNDVWDFGTSNQLPALKDNSGDLLPGQTAR